MSTKCGESDTTSGLAANPTVGRVFERLSAAGATLIFGETTEVTGGEDIIAAQCVNQKVADEFMKFFNDYQALVKSKGVDLLGSQPTEGNIRGGLTTIEEKAMGNIQKMGRCPVVGVLDMAVEPASPACTSWTPRPPPPRWLPCAPPRVPWYTTSPPARATSSATRSCR